MPKRSEKRDTAKAEYNRYRITNTAARCGKLPVGKNVTGWVPASYCNGGGITTK